MIIWGSRGREIEQGRGEFNCPQCDAQQHFRQVRVSTYFTLYFIPLFETQHHGDYVECQSCRMQFNPAVLSYTPPTATERMVASIQADLNSGTPLQMARTKLVNEKIEPAIADELVAAAAGTALHSCASCRLTYVPTIQKCSICGGALHSSGHRGQPAINAVLLDDAD